MLITIYQHLLKRQEIKKKEKANTTKICCMQNESLMKKWNNSKFHKAESCKSLFTIQENFALGYSQEKSTLIKSQSKKGRKNANLYSTLRYLSKYLHMGYKVAWHLNSSALQSNVVPFTTSFINARYITSLDESLPFISCTLIAYPALKAKVCIENINNILKRPLRIAFVGDSVVRILLEAFVRDYIKVFDFHFAASRYNLTLEEHFLDRKLKETISIFGRGLQLHFYWAPFLERPIKPGDQHSGAKEHLLRWAMNTTKEYDFPDLMILSSGMWSFGHFDYSEAFDNHLNMFTKLQNVLQILAKETKILWLAMPPVKPWLDRNNLKPSSNFIVEMLNKLTKIYLKKTDILFWDSLNPIVYKELSECHSLFKMQTKHNLFIPEMWRCLNYNHGGRRAMFMGVKLLWNFICSNTREINN